MDVDRESSKKSVWFWRAIFTILFLALAFAANFLLSFLGNSEPTVDRRMLVVDTVQHGTLVHEIRGIGQLVADDVSWVPARTDGRVISIAKLPGVPVQKDTLLIKMVNPDLELSQVDAQSELQTAAAELRSKHAGLKNQLLKMKSELVKLQADFDQAKATYEVAQELFEKNIEPKLQLELKKLKVDGFTKQLAVDNESYDSFEASIPDQIAVYSERKIQAAAKLNLENRKIESLTVTAGFDGVLAEVSVEVGQQITAGAPLAKVVNPRKLKAAIKIQEVQARFIKRGQIAKVDTHHGIVTGKVSRIDPEVKEGSVSVEITFDMPLPEEARPDLSVIGMIEIASLNDVTFVGRPADSLPEKDHHVFVLNASGDRATKQAIEIGIASINKIEVRKGLNKGDQVILSDMSRFDEIAEVRIQ